MPLTTFGSVCRQHRIRIGTVIADQSKATGVSPSQISAVEQGEIALPDDYVKKLVDWMQLDNLEALQLKKLSTLRPSRKKKVPNPLDLKGILDSLVAKKKCSE